MQSLHALFQSSCIACWINLCGLLFDEKFSREAGRTVWMPTKPGRTWMKALSEDLSCLWKHSTIPLAMDGRQ